MYKITPASLDVHNEKFELWDDGILAMVGTSDAVENFASGLQEQAIIEFKRARNERNNAIAYYRDAEQRLRDARALCEHVGMECGAFPSE